MNVDARVRRAANEQSAVMPIFSTAAVTSKDRTRIGYRQIGRGPGLILIQGAMGTAHNFDQLARALANDFTVYLPDRRGRGMSPREYTPDHSIRRDVEDIESLLVQSGAPSYSD